MSGIVYAAVADDDTGASDLAGMFADQGVRVTLVLDLPTPENLRRWSSSSQGIVFATATRALSAAEAYGKTAAAVQLALGLSPKMIQIKYCSTFDSNEQGNIGPSIDAAMDTLHEPFTIALPALPVNGRTTYCGYHFVKDRLLSDSHMRNHPLTPMTNPDLADLLGKQTRRPVGLTPYAVVESGPAAVARHWRQLREQGTQISILDCLNDRHAAGLSEAACELKLITGGSAFGTHLPTIWRRRAWIGSETPDLFAGSALIEGRGALIVAGSCSVATHAQNTWIAARGADVIELDPVRLLERGAGAEIDLAVGALRSGRVTLVKTRSSSIDIAKTAAWGRTQGLDSTTVGLRIAHALAALTCSLVQTHLPSVLISAGGETSTAICRALGIRALAVGRNIQPGVPLCLPLEGIGLPFVLKSGNFGSEDFYQLAIDAAGRLRRVRPVQN